MVTLGTVKVWAAKTEQWGAPGPSVSISIIYLTLLGFVTLLNLFLFVVASLYFPGKLILPPSLGCVTQMFLSCFQTDHTEFPIKVMTAIEFFFPLKDWPFCLFHSFIIHYNSNIDCWDTL